MGGTGSVTRSARSICISPSASDIAGVTAGVITVAIGFTCSIGFACAIGFGCVIGFGCASATTLLGFAGTLIGFSGAARLAAGSPAPTMKRPC